MESWKIEISRLYLNQYKIICNKKNNKSHETRFETKGKKEIKNGPI
jgi:hypothetical protein